MRYGLISDTHGYLDPRVKEIFQDVALILHAGDVGSPEVLRALRELAPVEAVRGNNDRKGACARLPRIRWISLEGSPTLLIHQIGKPSRLLPEVDRLLKRHRPSLVVYGHSHQPGDETKEGVRFFNPGSAGKKRFRLPRSCALLTRVGPSVRIQHLFLE